MNSTKFVKPSHDSGPGLIVQVNCEIISGVNPKNIKSKQLRLISTDSSTFFQENQLIKVGFDTSGKATYWKALKESQH